VLNSRVVLLRVHPLTQPACHSDLFLLARGSIICQVVSRAIHKKLSPNTSLDDIGETSWPRYGYQFPLQLVRASAGQRPGLIARTRTTKRAQFRGTSTRKARGDQARVFWGSHSRYNEGPGHVPHPHLIKENDGESNSSGVTSAVYTPWDPLTTDNSIAPGY